MKLTLGFSTCPNDTFIFDALIHQKIDTEGLEFEVQMADVEELNRNAFAGNIDITKLSYHAYAYLADSYKLLTSGSALGHKNGPLVISKHKAYPDELPDMKIAIPGKHTTANLLFSIAFANATKKSEYLFSDIEEAVLSGEVDAGVIIHENRFTYAQKGLKKIVDLGEKWETETKQPIPLGGIVIHRSHPIEVQRKVNRVLKRSIEFALQNPDSGLSFVQTHAREMEDKVIRQHIELYVNNYTIELGEKGREAVNGLYRKAESIGIIKKLPDDIFVE